MEELHLRVGDRHTIRFAGRGTAGYAWSAAVDEPRIVRVSSVGTAPRESSAGYAETGFSASRDELFELVALAPGSATIHFTQARPWEKDKPALAFRDFAVSVSLAKPG